MSFDTLLSGLASAPPRNVIVTGANSGVGLAGAKILTATGHHVVLACRTQAKADAAAEACLAFAAEVAKNAESGELPASKAKKGGGIKALPPFRAGGSAVGAVCDLADLESVRRFAATRKGGKKLDSLVLNAGLAMSTGDKLPQRTAQGFELTVGTNHLGHFLLANLLAPELASAATTGTVRAGDDGAAQAPRLIVTASPVHDPNSGGGNVGSKASLGSAMRGLEEASARGDGVFDMVDGAPYDPDKAYKDSKLCNLLFAAEASRRFAAKGILVDSFSPGLIPNPSGFFRYQNQGFAKTFEKISGFAGVSESNEFGGAALAFMAVDSNLPVKTNGWYDSFPPGKHQLSVHDPSAEAMDLGEQKLLWDLSAKLTGLTTPS